MNLWILSLFAAAAVLTECAVVNNNVILSLYRRGVKGQKVANSDKLTGLASSFNSQAKTYFIIHGWNGRLDTWTPKLIRALLKKDRDSNVIVVDWGKWARNPNYLQAKQRTDDVGIQLAKFIKRLEKAKGASRKRMHLLGHSLGGQVAGFAGEHLNPKVARITGLDTSGIGFKCTTDDTDCLDHTDADFVDEIHTLVSAVPKGHADFYTTPVEYKVKGKNIFQKIFNSHFLAIDYFIKSLEAGTCAFRANKCTSQLNHMDGKCKNNDVNRVGYYATKPRTSPPNRYYIDVDMKDPCH